MRGVVWEDMFVWSLTLSLSACVSDTVSVSWIMCVSGKQYVWVSVHERAMTVA